ncbi:MAG TPA: hypothetical protein VF125_11845 [Solirubrobacterales bacterium]
MRTKNSALGLPLIAFFAVAVGALLSGFVLSLSPLAGFGVIFGVSGLIVLLVEVAAYFKRQRNGPRPHLLSSYFEERQNRARRKSPKPEPDELDAEVVESYQEGWVQ